jgi:hypothetical protein
MEYSVLVAVFVGVLAVIEIAYLIRGRIQEQAEKSKLTCLIVVILSAAVLVAIQDKVLGGAETRFVFYGVFLLFNIGLFGTLLLRSMQLGRRMNKPEV